MLMHLPLKYVNKDLRLIVNILSTSVWLVNVSEHIKYRFLGQKAYQQL